MRRLSILMASLAGLFSLAQGQEMTLEYLYRYNCQTGPDHLMNARALSGDRAIVGSNQGLALTERENPSLVILDMMMPKRSGFLVLEKLRRTREDPPRVIMITANEGSRHKAYAEMLGVDDYLRKPFPMDRLIESVKRLLG